MPAKLSTILALMISLAALLGALGVPAPGVALQSKPAPASLAAAPAPAAQSGVLYLANHGNWG